MTAEEPGVRPLSTALEEEGFDGLESGRLMESFTRHFMVALDVWQEDGFVALAKQYFERLPGKSGTRREIAENGDLLIQSVLQHVPERRELLPALGRPSWRDAETGNILR
jgi:hypothetical protein